MSMFALTIWETALGDTIKAVLMALGVIVVIIAIIKAVGAVGQGKIPQAVKIVVGAAVLAAFMFRPELIDSVINLFGSIADKVLGSSTEIVDGKKATPAP